MSILTLWIVLICHTTSLWGASSPGAVLPPPPVVAGGLGGNASLARHMGGAGHTGATKHNSAYTPTGMAGLQCGGCPVGAAFSQGAPVTLTEVPSALHVANVFGSQALTGLWATTPYAQEAGLTGHYMEYRYTSSAAWGNADPLLIVLNVSIHVCKGLTPPGCPLMGLNSASVWENIATSGEIRAGMSPPSCNYANGITPVLSYTVRSATNGLLTSGQVSTAPPWTGAPVTGPSRIAFTLNNGAQKDFNSKVSFYHKTGTFNVLADLNPGVTPQITDWLEGGNSVANFWTANGGTTPRPIACAGNDQVALGVALYHARCGAGQYMEGTSCKQCPCGTFQPNAIETRQISAITKCHAIRDHIILDPGETADECMITHAHELMQR